MVALHYTTHLFPSIYIMQDHNLSTVSMAHGQIPHCFPFAVPMPEDVIENNTDLADKRSLTTPSRHLHDVVRDDKALKIKGGSEAGRH
jgi:hypothetical protein